MKITLNPRTRETVRIYFEKASAPEIKEFLPQKAKTVEEALADYEQTLLPGAASFGQTIYADGNYVGDVWCYCIDPGDEPNCMVSYCVFDPAYRSKGVATAALGQFIRIIREKFPIQTIGAFTYSRNTASIRVLERCGFSLMEEFEEDGTLSKYFQYTEGADANGHHG